MSNFPNLDVPPPYGTQAYFDFVTDDRGRAVAAALRFLRKKFEAADDFGFITPKELFDLLDDTANRLDPDHPKGLTDE